MSPAIAHLSLYETPQIPVSARPANCDPIFFKKTPSQQEGPFYFKAPRKSDITENLPGTPLTLRIGIVGRRCVPFPRDQVVSIWHAAPDGTYRYVCLSVYSISRALQGEIGSRSA